MVFNTLLENVITEEIRNNDISLKNRASQGGRLWADMVENETGGGSTHQQVVIEDSDNNSNSGSVPHNEAADNPNDSSDNNVQETLDIQAAPYSQNLGVSSHIQTQVNHE